MKTKNDSNKNANADANQDVSTPPSVKEELSKTFPEKWENDLREIGKEFSKIGRSYDSIRWTLCGKILEQKVEKQVPKDVYMRASELTGISVAVLKNYVSTALRVDYKNRQEDKLSFTHHSAVAALPSRQQKKVLSDAVKNNWSVAEIGKAVSKRKAPAKSEETLSIEDEQNSIKEILKNFTTAMDTFQKVFETWDKKTQLKTAQSIIGEGAFAIQIQELQKFEENMNVIVDSEMKRVDELIAAGEITETVDA